MERTKWLVRIATVGCVATLLGCADEPQATSPPAAALAMLTAVGYVGRR